MKIRLPDLQEVEAEIVYVVQEEEDRRVLVFKINEKVEKLLEYREIRHRYHLVEL